MSILSIGLERGEKIGLEKEWLEALSCGKFRKRAKYPGTGRKWPSI